MKIPESELILTPEGRIYHINLKPEDLATKIILVGDPNRVPLVSKHFDTIEFTTQKREIVAHTGVYKGVRMTVISTGMGPDNIDIVLTELDAVANVDFEKRELKENFTQLEIVRIGTSGSFQKDILVDSFVAASHTIGFDNVLHSYSKPNDFFESSIENEFIKHTNWEYQIMGRPYVLKTDEDFVNHFIHSDRVHKGFTATAGGFYGPQGRQIRLQAKHPELNDLISSFSYEGLRITNMEMETSAIYGLSKLMGHKACSMNCIIANRANGTFSDKPYQSVEELIEYTLNRFVLL